jgi:hypothetical protein
MATIRNVYSDSNTLIAPPVYIDSVEFYKDTCNIVYSLEDNIGDWSVSNEVLESCHVHILLNNQKKSIKLKDIVSNSKFIKNTITSQVTFQQSLSGTLSASAYCGNDNLQGILTTELIADNGKITSAFYATERFSYINKVKNLNLFDISIPLTSSQASYSTYLSPLYVSYRSDKKANIGFIIDIEQFLLQKSPYYKTLAQYKYFKDVLLSRSTINTYDSSFGKLNLTLGETRYTKIENAVYSRRLDSNKYKYYVTATDDNAETNNKYRYQVESRIKIRDPSYDFFQNNIKNKILTAKEHIKSYVSLFNLHSVDSIDKKINEYIFIEHYDKGLNIKTIIKTITDEISHIASFYNNKSLEEYTSFILSILHPLSTNVTLLGKFLDFLNTLESISDKLFRDIEAFSDPEIQNYVKYSPEINIEFKTLSEHIDYDYDYLCGYDVISIDNKDTRLAEINQGTKRVSKPEKDVRLNYEAKKYIKVPTMDQVASSKYLSISQLDLKNNSYDLLTGLAGTGTRMLNDLFIKLSEYNNHDFEYRKEESLYFQLADDGNCIKSISAGINTSKNRLNRSVVFDPNQESSAQSLYFLTSTGIEDLFFILDPLELPTPPDDSLQYAAGYTTDSPQTAVFRLTQENRQDPGAKSKILCFYGSIYEDVIVEEGSNYNIMSLSPVKGLSQLFTKKLKLYNEYYLLAKSESSEPRQIELKQLDYTKDLESNIPAKHLNRNTQGAVFKISTDILL